MAQKRLPDFLLFFKMVEVMHSFQQTLSEIANWHLFTSGGTPVTVKALGIAVLLLVVGFWVSAKISRRVEIALAWKRQLERNQRHLISTLIFYFLAAFSSMIALRLAGIPWTVFTLAGEPWRWGLASARKTSSTIFCRG